MATTYTINRSTTPGAEAPIATGITTESFVDTTVVSPNTYYYTVTRVTSSGSATSSEVSASV